jgi:phosphonate transport system substrate-binding protein
MLHHKRCASAELSHANASPKDLAVWRLLLTLALIGGLPSPARAAPQSYSFGVLSQRSAVLTAQYWNPILTYVGEKAGVDLRLKLTHTAPECNEGIANGVYDFVYSNTIFQPSNLPSGYQVILRPEANDISGQIVTLEDSPVKALAELKDKVVGFPSNTAFVGYVVPMDHLRREHIPVVVQFGGNQEGIMGQLKAGKVAAAAVNSQLMRAFADREGFRYRVLWQSQLFPDLPISFHPRVDAMKAQKIQKAFAAMGSDPEGLKILQDSAAVIQRKPPYGFLPAGQADYQGYIDAYRAALETESN